MRVQETARERRRNIGSAREYEVRVMAMVMTEATMVLKRTGEYERILEC